MKKFLTLVLALALALALAVPAMAFTTVTEDEDVVAELDIYLVEFEDDEFFGLTGMPPSDRGYAKNEIVAAIVELTVPDDYDADKALDVTDYKSLIFDGDSVSLKVTENAAGKGFMVSKNVTDAAAVGTIVFGSDITLPITAAGFDQDDTYKFLFFAKVTGDEASLTATLDADDADWVVGTPTTLDVGDYIVEKGTDQYVITDGTDDLFKITLDDNETQDLYIFDEAGIEYLAVNPEAGVFYTLAGVREDDKGTIRDLQAVYEDVFVEEFGFDFSVSGGILKDSYFEDMVGTDDIEATVEIKPWTAYVTVPDNIVVDPPKTGDAASIVGFVMIVLAAAAVVAVKKVRA